MKAFKFDGVNSTSKGIKVGRNINISSAIPNVTQVKIPGRNGGLHYWDGSYQNRIITVDCYVIDNSIFDKINSINEWLIKDAGYKEFQDVDDLSHFMLARAVNGVSHDIRANILAPFELEFDAKPQRFLVSGKTEVTVNSGQNTIVNPTQYDSLPILKISADARTEPIVFHIGDSKITFKGIYGSWEYDCENDYMKIIDKSPDSENPSAILDKKFTISSGSNAMYYDVPSLVSSFKIVPRWWEL